MSAYSRNAYVSSGSGLILFRFFPPLNKTFPRAADSLSFVDSTRKDDSLGRDVDEQFICSVPRLYRSASVRPVIGSAIVDKDLICVGSASSPLLLTTWPKNRPEDTPNTNQPGFSLCSALGLAGIHSGLPSGGLVLGFQSFDHHVVYVYFHDPDNLLAKHLVG